MITASDYFGFVTILALTFGAVFELPLLILALAALGLVTPKFLAKFRRYALVLSFVVSAIITPGDIFIATMALTIPLYLLYEVSVLLASIVFRKRQAANYSAEQSAAGGMA
jgi:sec-independent protein translocase protein TatC